MAGPRDALPVPESMPFSSTPRAERMGEDEASALTLHQEINERRARLENAELLQNLRGL